MPRPTWRRVAAALALALLGAPAVWAANPVAALGAHLTRTERLRLLGRFGVRADVPLRIAVVTDRERQVMLRGIVPPESAALGSQAGSYLVPQHVGFGLQIVLSQITGVTAPMVASALATAGISNATVRVAATRPVPGPAAMPAMIWAYQASTGQIIALRQQRTAVRALVLMAQLGRETKRPSAVVRAYTDMAGAVAGRRLARPAVRAAVVRIGRRWDLHWTPQQREALVTLMTRITQLNLAPSTWRAQVWGARNEGEQARTLWSTVIGWASWAWRRVRVQVAVWVHAVRFLVRAA
jgi:uncharacterized protein YpuA (DUF1002 family)